MSETIKVERKSILLGSIPIEVFRLPSGEYRLSQSQSCNCINENEIHIRRFIGSDAPEALPYKDLTLDTGKVLTERVRVKLVPISLAAAYWGYEAQRGNQAAMALLIASASESIQRRADTAFGVTTLEEEYNRQFEELRAFGVQARRDFTDAIQDYISRNKVGGNRAKWMYKNATDELNRTLFGKNAKKLRLEKGRIIRDGCSLRELRDLEILEASAAKLVDGNNMDPIQAIRAATKLWRIISPQ